jgi:hypothetical protein
MKLIFVSSPHVTPRIEPPSISSNFEWNTSAGSHLKNEDLWLAGDYDENISKGVDVRISSATFWGAFAERRWLHEAMLAGGVSYHSNIADKSFFSST